MQMTLTVNCKVKAIAVFLAGGNADPGLNYSLPTNALYMYVARSMPVARPPVPAQKEHSQAACCSR